MVSATDRERDALARAGRDAWRLALLDTMLASVIDTVGKLAGPLESPGRRWHPGDLVDDMQSHREAIRRELARLRSPVVIETDT